MAWGFIWQAAMLFVPIGGMIGTNPAASVSLGNLAFRQANFEEAESYYKQALSADSKCARALLGLGKIEELHFRRAAARDYFSAAYRSDPRDPQVIRSYAGVVADRDVQTTLWRNYVALGGEDRAGVAEAVGRIRVNEQLGGREIGILESPYRAYQLPMRPFFPTARPGGMMLMVSINGCLCV